MNVFTSGYRLVWSFLLPDARYFEQIIHYHRIFLQPKPPKRLSKFIQSLLLLIHLWKHEGAESRGVEESCGMFTLPHTMLNCQLTVKLGPDTGPRQYAPGHGACADRAQRHVSGRREERGDHSPDHAAHCTMWSKYKPDIHLFICYRYCIYLHVTFISIRHLFNSHLDN